MALRRIKLSDLLFGVSATPAALHDSTPAAAPSALADDASASVLQSLNQLNRRLEHTLTGLREHASAHAELRAIAVALLRNVRLGPDIALAAVLLNQIAGGYGVRHCLESAIVALLAGQRMNKSDAELLVLAAAALTMNVGMVHQADAFHGREGALTHDERALVRRHPHDSVELLRWAGVVDEEWLSCVLLHHENDDGSGYPDGRMGHDIADNARLIGAADRYCAMVSARNYRRSLLPPLALARLNAELAPEFAAAFEAALGPYPSGTLVKMKNGETAVVAGSDGAARLKICALRDSADQPVERFSSEAPGSVDAALHEDDACLRFTMRQVWGELAAL